MNRETPSMALVKDRSKWSLLLAGCFLSAVLITACYLYIFSVSDLLQNKELNLHHGLYTGLGLILLSGGLALWVTFHDRRKTTISTLPASNDTHERKKIELEIQHQNRKITESIRYAKRIQGAILPNPALIHRALPDSFILYKPKDVVSGDFPWFVQVKNEIFMAAVDCTGHGVPGALLSLVGYFLLNDIVRSRKITDPGRILDLLDEGVATTLRPDEDAGSKDGMDISLCKINREQRIVEYSGAHRPLYVMQNGELHEIKGNRFPIGGGIFKNQTSFGTKRLQLNRGDSIYFCSDGFSDQFGGPAGRKFGTKQLREMIVKVHAMPMKEAVAVFEETWESWRGNQKQTDDVLLIGVKF
jgi:serine phosphatase RsbU (regulator of sigma subunit)